MTDAASIEAAARALHSVAAPRDIYRLQTGAVVVDADEACAAILAAVIPLIKAAALEQAAKLADDYVARREIDAGEDIAAAIRALIPDKPMENT